LAETFYVKFDIDELSKHPRTSGEGSYGKIEAI
jgi:hypothetical protein